MGVFELVNVALFAIVVVTALVISHLRALYSAVMLAALLSLVSASLFVLLDAVDVAFTEAAVGAGISTVLFLSALATTRSREAVTPRRKLWPGALVAVFTGGTLLYASQDLPGFGGRDTPVQRHPITDVYLHESQHQIGSANTVTGVLASYRGYDTLGELAVIFTAGVAVLLMLTYLPRQHEAVERGTMLADYRVLRVVSAILLPFILLFALYVQFHGDYGPGGGFQAGVIFASAFVLYGLVFGMSDARRAMPRRVLFALIPLGLLVYAGVGVVNLLLGGSFLDYGTLVPHEPEQGQHLGIMLIELGVAITVAAVLTSVFFVFAGRRLTR